ncbi:MAG: PEP-CTERM sorting domain-containing protein [Brasilonema sp.]
MGLLNKFSFAAAAGAAAFVVGTAGSTPAEAAQFKFTFEGEGASGYFIYDKDTTKIEPPGSEGYLGEFDGSVLEYSVSFADGTSASGKKGSQADVHDEARNVVYLEGPWDTFGGYEGTTQDNFILYVPPASRDSQYGLSIRFTYPEGTIGTYSEGTTGANELPTTLPDSARVRVYPYWDYPNTNGGYTFEGTVRTRLEKIPEPASSAALLGVGTWYILRRRQQKKVQTVQTSD